MPPGELNRIPGGAGGLELNLDFGFPRCYGERACEAAGRTVVCPLAVTSVRTRTTPCRAGPS
eukprot:SAG11_NODE_2127_length_3781_cov_2.239272_3_plen_62_part_00